jgi:hypothetical protein
MNINNIEILSNNDLNKIKNKIKYLESRGRYKDKY